MITGTPFSGRMIGYAGGKRNHTVSILENKNLDDPSNPADWLAADGTDGQIHVDWTGAPTTKHEDYRLHIFDHNKYECNGDPRRYWLFVIPDGVGPGRACGRLGFAARSLGGPFEYCNWLVAPNSTGPAGGPTSNCDSWPGDVIQADDSLFFIAGWGNIYQARVNTERTLSFERVAGDPMIATPAPPGQWDDLHQIEYTFLPPPANAVGEGKRWRLYHASYSKTTVNPHATRADYGYKASIGMYSFDWDVGGTS